MGYPYPSYVLFWGPSLRDEMFDMGVLCECRGISTAWAPRQYPVALCPL